MGKHLVILPPLSRTFCSLLGMEFIKYQVLLRQSREERAGKQGPNTLYQNCARFGTARPIFLKFLVRHQHTSTYYYLFKELLELGEMLRVNFRCSISIAGRYTVYHFNISEICLTRQTNENKHDLL